MKVNDSGMPDEEYWNSLFDVDEIVDWLALPTAHTSTVVEIGCGYGTFTAPIARKLLGQLVAFDIEPDMVECTRHNLAQNDCNNVHLYQRDIIDLGTGLDSDSVDMVLLFNILHFNDRRLLLQEAARILKPGGIVAIIHWRKDIPTPRGPIHSLRPSEQDILTAATGLSLISCGAARVLEPYHWGIKMSKTIPIRDAKS